MTSSNTTIDGGGTVSQNLLNAVNGTSSSSSSSSSSTSSTSGSSLQQTFLQLLVAQLQNQDPTNPMDSSQMTAQLAQINTVTGISQLNTTLTSLASQLSAGTNSQASLLIGQNVLVPGSTTTVASGASSGFGVTLSSAVSDVKVTIKDKSGNIVNTVDLGAQSAGTVPVSWKPTDSSGNTLADGTYSISATATSSTGATASVTTLSGAQVESVVQQSDGSTGLLLNNGSTVGMSSVSAIL
ncbi:flagellar hook assembly protein FlgD [Trinickia dinghuensis]|uniref:Basal-body rod modification protein FlgD n=1 Tax=Trinickia dinghuensis TaxID=2291023 RepID=A0A3D8JZN8_9BURK|nr:flagellar hook assembly protein FlgD [Trinickia dinghuensis]RDU98350.1 flagellar hook assembly protein FlgD [Trinickia dinghuensis]